MLGFWRRRRAHARHGAGTPAVLSGWSEPAPAVVPLAGSAASAPAPLFPPPQAAARLDDAPPAAAPGATAVALVFADGAVVSLAADDPRVRPFQAALAVLVSR